MDKMTVDFKDQLDAFLLERMLENPRPVNHIAEWAGRARLGYELAKFAEQPCFEQDYPLFPRFANGIGVETDVLEKLIYLPQGFLEWDRQCPRDQRFETLSGDDRSAFLTLDTLTHKAQQERYRWSQSVDIVLGIPVQDKIRRLIHDPEWRGHVREYCHSLLDVAEQVLKLTEDEVAEHGAGLSQALQSLICQYRSEMVE